MALTAFIAQIFMSKVAFMSGAALILAKIALLFSALVTSTEFLLTYNSRFNNYLN